MPKINKKWIALCTAAIGAIYAVEYMTTDPQSFVPELTGQTSVQADIPKLASPSSSPVPDYTAPSSPSKSPRASSSPSESTAKKTYKDGTYIGMGNNRRGFIEVSVTISNDRITDVEISNFGMHYSESDVVGLPAEVLRKQSATVDNVSGATYSTDAFRDAVNEALSQAKNA